MRMPFMSRRVCDFAVVFEVAFAVVLPKAYLSFLTEQFAERPGAVKGAFCAAQRTLDGEDRSATLPLGREGGTICAMLLRPETTTDGRALNSRRLDRQALETSQPCVVLLVLT